MSIARPFACGEDVTGPFPSEGLRQIEPGRVVRPLTRDVPAAVVLDRHDLPDREALGRNRVESPDDVARDVPVHPDGASVKHAVHPEERHRHVRQPVAVHRALRPPRPLCRDPGPLSVRDRMRIRRTERSRLAWCGSILRPHRVRGGCRRDCTHGRTRRGGKRCQSEEDSPSSQCRVGIRHDRSCSPRCRHPQ